MKSKKEITGIIFGVFDLLHLGHLVALEEAKKQCDYLIVGLKTDTVDVDTGETPPAQTMVERFIKLEGCQYVDEIIPYDSDRDLLDILQSLSIDIRFLGEEQRDHDYVGKSFCDENNIECTYLSRKHRFSSTGLRQIVRNKEAAKLRN